MILLRKLALVLAMLTASDSGYVITGNLHLYAGQAFGMSSIQYSYGPDVFSTTPILRVAVAPRFRWWWSITIGPATVGRGHANFQSPWFNWMSE